MEEEDARAVGQKRKAEIQETKKKKMDRRTISIIRSAGILGKLCRGEGTNHPIGSKIVKDYGKLSEWDMSDITDLSNFFVGVKSIDEDISHWDVSNVTNMYQIFKGVTSFNQPLDKWNVSNVTNFSDMFHGATSFNNSLAGWRFATNTVVNMTRMFYGAEAFNNESITSWTIPRNTNLNSMFRRATSFNQNINSWRVDAGNMNVGYMFCDATSFNQPLDQWSVHYPVSMNVEIYGMFQAATSFDQPLHNWTIWQGIQNKREYEQIVRQIFSGAQRFLYNILANLPPLTNAEDQDWRPNLLPRINQAEQEDEGLHQVHIRFAALKITEIYEKIQEFLQTMEIQPPSTEEEEQRDRAEMEDDSADDQEIAEHPVQRDREALDVATQLYRRLRRFLKQNADPEDEFLLMESDMFRSKLRLVKFVIVGLPYLQEDVPTADFFNTVLTYIENQPPAAREAYANVFIINNAASRLRQDQCSAAEGSDVSCSKGMLERILFSLADLSALVQDDATITQEQKQQYFWFTQKLYNHEIDFEVFADLVLKECDAKMYKDNPNHYSQPPQQYIAQMRECIMRHPLHERFSPKLRQFILIRGEGGLDEVLENWQEEHSEKLQNGYALHDAYRGRRGGRSRRRQRRRGGRRTRRRR